MTSVTVLATHLPCWGTELARLAGHDEDVVTLAVAAGRLAVEAAPTAPHAVVLVTREVPTLAAGTEAVLLAGLGLSPGVRCTIVLGGAPGTTDALTSVEPGTLVLAVDLEPTAGAAAAVVGDAAGGTEVTALARSERSLPLRTRDDRGARFDYDDPRLERVRGTQAALARLDLADVPVAMAGVSHKEVSALTRGAAPQLPTTGASSTLFALASLVEAGSDGILAALEQASGSALTVRCGGTTVLRSARKARPVPAARLASEASIGISLPAYDRAFDSKVGLQAGQCASCGTLALPPRRRCLGCGSEAAHPLTPLPRTGTVYTAVTVNVPVPGLRVPYQLAIVELGQSGVRLLAPVTGGPPDGTTIGGGGALVLRRLSTRNGVPDYGYAFEPTSTEEAVA